MFQDFNQMKNVSVAQFITDQKEKAIESLAIIEVTVFKSTSNISILYPFVSAQYNFPPKTCFIKIQHPMQNKVLIKTKIIF